MVGNLSELGLHLQKIVTRLESNQNLMKLLYYDDKNPYNHPDMTSTFIKDNIYEKRLKIIPVLLPQETAQSAISIKVMNGLSNFNKEFRNISIAIDVFVPMTQWFIKDSNLRPFAIMGEIQKSLNGKRIDGLGKLDGGDFVLTGLTAEMSIYEMDFKIIEYD